MMMTLTRYALADHVESDDVLPDDPGWKRMDSVVLTWLSNSISSELKRMVRERGHTARYLWVVIESQFLDNREQRTLHLDLSFRSFTQGDLSVNDYCHKYKAMADDLADLGAPVEDRLLCINILRGLHPRLQQVGMVIRHHDPFPNFLKLRDELVLEEIHMENAAPAAPTAFYTTTTPSQPPAPKQQQPSTSSGRPPSGGGQSKNKNKGRGNGNSGNNGGGKSATGGGNRGASSGTTTAAPTAAPPPAATGPPQWPTYGNPWQGQMTMYPGPLPAGQHP